MMTEETPRMSEPTTTFDYIVVGAGTAAACPLAARAWPHRT